MKEATGELSMTAIVVGVIAIVALIAPFIVRTVGQTTKLKTICATASCGACNAGTKSCRYLPDATDSNPQGSANTDGTYTISCSC